MTSLELQRLFVSLPPDRDSPSPSLSVSTSTSTVSSITLSDVGVDEQGDGGELRNLLCDAGSEASAKLAFRPAVLTHLSSGSITSQSSSSIPSSSTPSPVTPLSPNLHAHLPSSDGDYQSSPGSIAGTAKDGLTPRAEISQPVWPSSYLTIGDRQAKGRFSEEPDGFTGGGLFERTVSLKRDESWGKKQASPDTSSTTALPENRSSSRPASGGQVPTKNGSFASHHLEQAPTGCCISAPIAPPAHYPIPPTPSSSSSGRRRVPSSPASYDSGNSPEPPRWAQPPSVRPKSFGDPRPDTAESDIEVIKGTEGRIAVKATRLFYEIMVWLPGFTLDNITIVTRGARTVHIVADQWDEGDHAQWDIKLGDDANMRSISAKFGGNDLKITVGRQQVSPPLFVKPQKSSVSTPNTPAQDTVARLSTPLAPPVDFWASQWSPHPMTRRTNPKQPSMKTI